MALLPAPVAPTALRHALRLLLVAAVVLSSHAGSLADEKPKSKTKTKTISMDLLTWMKFWGLTWLNSMWMITIFFLQLQRK